MTEVSPETREIRQLDTHRLVPARFVDPVDDPLAKLAADAADLATLDRLVAATDDARSAEAALLPGIGPHELVYGVPNAELVNASFCHASPLGGRFNAPDRGAWYAGFELETSIAEVVHHRTRILAESGHFEDSVQLVDLTADIAGNFADLRGDPRFSSCLSPVSYVASQALAERLLRSRSLGIVYPSVRHAGGTCVAVFRPAVVANVRRAGRIALVWRGSPEPEIGPVT